MLNRWLSVGLLAAMFPALVSAPVGAVSPTGLEQQDQNVVLPAGVELPPQLLAANTQERRVALIIGNGNYEGSGKLNNPPNDARDMAAALKSLGFEVTLHLDLSHQEMEEEVDRFNRKLSQGGVGLFYYAGHGVQISNENYLIPVGTKLRREQDVRYKTLALGQVLGAMEDAGNRLNIVILDACRDNPILPSWSRSLKRGLAPIKREPEGTVIAFATAPGDVAIDGEGRNSPYTATLLQQLKVADIPLPLVFERVRQEVRKKTQNQQSPRYISSGGGDFFFNSSTLLNSQSALGHVEQGKIKYKKGDLDGAIADYDRALSLNPQNASAYYNRSIVRYRKGNLDGALADLDKVISLDPRNSENYEARGYLHLQKGDLDGVFADYDKAISLNPQSFNAYLGRGYVYSEKGDLDSALSDYDKAISLNPQNFSAYNDRGLVRRKKGDLDGALADFNKAISLNSQSLRSYSNRADLLKEKGDLDGANADYRRVDELESQQ